MEEEEALMEVEETSRIRLRIEVMIIIDSGGGGGGGRNLKIDDHCDMREMEIVEERDSCRSSSNQ